MTTSSGSKSPFYAEDLDGKVQKPATFYVTCNNTMIRGIDLRQISKTRTFPSAPWKSWPNDPFLVEQELPPEMGPRWSYKVMTAPPEAFAPFVSDLQVGDDTIIPYFPDIFPLMEFPTVSQRARDVLEELFPDGSYFLPINILSADGTPIDVTYYSWVQRHRFVFFVSMHEWNPDLPQLSWPFYWGGASNYMMWQLSNNPAVRAFLSKFPFWGKSYDCLLPVYNAPTFAALKAAKLTGLVEATSDRPSQIKDHHSIGPVA